MNSWATNPRNILLLVAVLLLSACGNSTSALDAARTDALQQLDAMAFVDEPHRLEQAIQVATSTREVQNLLRLAQDSDQEREELFWSCASRGMGMLPRAWSTIAITGDGDWFNQYQLSLEPSGQARLEVTGGAEMIGEPALMDDAARWLEKSVGKVTGWSADLDDVITSRRLPKGQRAVMSGRTVCTVPFSLTLREGRRDRVLGASLKFGFKSSRTLFIDGQPFEETP